MSDDDIHEDLFKGANRKFRKVNWTKVATDKHNKPKDESQIKKISARLIEKENEKRKKIEELGLKYEFPGYEGQKTETVPKKGKEAKEAKKVKKTTTKK